MADPAPGLAPQSGAQGITADPDKLASQAIAADIAGMRKSVAQEKTAAEKSAQELAASQQKTETGVRSWADRAASLKRPELGEEPKLQPTSQTSPIQAWTSAAMMLAAVGSLFTRRPLATAMKSATEALNAFRQGDQDRANAAFAKWKVDTDNFWKVANYQQEIYKETLGEYMDMAKLEADLGSQRQNAIFEESKALGQAFGDERVAYAKSIEEIVHWTTDRDRLIEQERTHQSEIITGIELQEAKQKYESEHGVPTTAAEISAENQFLGQIVSGSKGGWSPPRIAGWQNQQQSLATKNGITGANWNAVTNKLTAIAAAAKQSEGGKPLSSVEQTTLADAFTQIVNGGRAIRGFQMKMLTEQRSLVDNYYALAQKVLGRGGDLSPQQVSDMIRIAKTIAREADAGMREYVKNTVQAGTDLGIPQEDLKPTNIFKWYDDKKVSSLIGSSAPPEAVSLLKQHPNDPSYRASFDKHFGDGAADEALSAP